MAALAVADAINIWEGRGRHTEDGVLQGSAGCTILHQRQRCGPPFRPPADSRVWATRYNNCVQSVAHSLIAAESDSTEQGEWAVPD